MSSFLQFLSTRLSNGWFPNSSWTPHPVHWWGRVDRLSYPIRDVSNVLFSSTREATPIVVLWWVKCCSRTGGITEDIDTWILNQHSISVETRRHSPERPYWLVMLIAEFKLLVKLLSLIVKSVASGNMDMMVEKTDRWQEWRLLKVYWHADVDHMRCYDVGRSSLRFLHTQSCTTICNESFAWELWMLEYINGYCLGKRDSGNEAWKYSVGPETDENRERGTNINVSG